MFIAPLTLEAKVLAKVILYSVFIIIFSTCMGFMELSYKSAGILFCA